MRANKSRDPSGNVIARFISQIFQRQSKSFTSKKQVNFGKDRCGSWLINHLN
jgi:hypothetical protein